MTFNTELKVDNQGHRKWLNMLKASNNITLISNCIWFLNLPKVINQFQQMMFINTKFQFKFQNHNLTLVYCDSFTMPTRRCNLSVVVRNQAFCICENKDADQLCGNREADQRLCFRYTDSTIHLHTKYEISSLQPSSLVVQPGLCRTLSETPKIGFLTPRLI